MKVQYEIYPTIGRGLYTKSQKIGEGELEGETLEEIKEKASRIANSAEEAKEFLFEGTRQYFQKKRDKFLLRILQEGKKAIIVKPDDKNSNNKNNKSMNKKDFKDPILDILEQKPETPKSFEEEETTTSQEPKRKVGRPKKDRSQESESENEARTYKLRSDLLQKLKLISIKMGRNQTEIVEYALTELIDRYEKKNGSLDVTESPKSFEEFF